MVYTHCNTDVLAEHQVDLDQDSTQKLMDGYNSLSVFSETPPGLARLLDNPNLILGVFSNGTSSMVSNSVLRSKDLSPNAGIFHDIVPVDANRKFKPAPETYWYLCLPNTVGQGNIANEPSMAN
ncbi:hypothetical protein EMCG_05878 [[Emmonsia] crescens]|uniref:Uncharacterized protein n=1 Tax=[Emmonsia] crescens TaxID=73230 RepID=A0A0G2IDT3_9EURO|nr:hypothetical protein EMCG_05878 [Emmonsia crescens UAMH 3008]